MADEHDLSRAWRLGDTVVSPAQFHTKVVDDYLNVVRWSRRDPKDMEKYGDKYGPTGWTEMVPMSGAAKRYYDRCHLLLRENIREARIFEIVPDMFIRIDAEVDHYLTEEISGLQWKPIAYNETTWGRLALRPKISDEEYQQYRKAVRNASAEIGPPIPRPFSTMWLGMGSMIVLASRQMGVQQVTLHGKPAHIADGPRIVGILISDNFCCEVNRAIVNVHGEEQESIVTIPLWINDMWTSPELGHPWILNTIVDILNQQDSYEQVHIIDKRKFSERRWWQSKTKKLGLKGAITVLPPMYYTVTIKPSTRDEKIKLGMQSARNWTHRWDVRGHRITKAMAGPKPLSPVLRRKLLARGYTIIENPDELTDEQAAILKRHHKSFPSDVTWGAMKIGFRHDLIKGPEDKPYIPATWKLQKERERGEQ